MLHILNGVNGDLIAAEAKYHKNCFATYVSKKTTLSLPKGEALDSPHERSWKALSWGSCKVEFYSAQTRQCAFKAFINNILL